MKIFALLHTYLFNNISYIKYLIRIWHFSTLGNMNINIYLNLVLNIKVSKFTMKIVNEIYISNSCEKFALKFTMHSGSE